MRYGQDLSHVGRQPTKDQTFNLATRAHGRKNVIPQSPTLVQPRQRTLSPEAHNIDQAEYQQTNACHSFRPQRSCFCSQTPTTSNIISHDFGPMLSNHLSAIFSTLMYTDELLPCSNRFSYSVDADGWMRCRVWMSRPGEEK